MRGFDERLRARVAELEARDNYAQHRVQTAVERGLLALDKPTDPGSEREALRAILHGIAGLARVMEAEREALRAILHGITELAKAMEDRK